MKGLIAIAMLLIISIPCYAQESQESYTLLMLDFEDMTGIQNPLLARFNDTMAFVLSRQTGPAQVRMVPTSDRDALLARAAKMQPDATALEQGLLAAEWVDADALITGSYTKQKQWSLEAQVYHHREGRRARQEIQIQGDSLYKLLDDFPAHLLQQFAASYVALTTESWKAYEEYRKGHEAFDNYDFFVALEYYDKALELDPTLALAYAEQSYVYFMTGRPEQATKSIEAAKQWLPKASPMEQLAIRILDYGWDAEKNEYRTREIIDMAPGGMWDEVLIHQLVADAYTEEGKQAEADQHNQQWFEARQRNIRAHPDDASLLHSTASRFWQIGLNVDDEAIDMELYVDEAIDMELKAVELGRKESCYRGPRYILSSLYGRKGDMEQALEWAKRSIETVQMTGNWYIWYDYSRCWRDLATWLREGKIRPERLIRWCEDVLSIPGLHPAHRLHAQYMIAEIYEFMDDTAKADAILASLGAPRESDWTVIGPFDAPQYPFPDTPPSELLTDLTASHMGIMDKEIQWESWEDEHPMDGILRIRSVFYRRYFGKGGSWWGNQPTFSVPSVAYSCIYVEVPTAMEVQVRMGAGMMRIWLNDDPSPVIEGDAGWVAIPDHEISTVSLRAGLNRFLVATAYGASAFDFTFRITGHNGNAIPGLRYISAKEALASH